MSAKIQELERRVDAIERVLQSLVPVDSLSKKNKDWRRTVGMFAGDTEMAEIFARGKQIREADRKKARR